MADNDHLGKGLSLALFTILAGLFVLSFQYSFYESKTPLAQSSLVGLLVLLLCLSFYWLSSKFFNWPFRAKPIARNMLYTSFFLITLIVLIASIKNFRIFAFALFTSKTESTLTETPVPNIKVGVYIMDNYLCGNDDNPGEIITKLRLFGFDADAISSKDMANYGVLKKFDVIYLPGGWGVQTEYLQQNQGNLLEFLKNGGGLIVEQPNQKLEYKDYYLPYPITFSPGSNDPLNKPSELVENHSIIDGLSASEFPEAGNNIVDWASEYKVLTKTRIDNFPTLLVAEYEGGRIVVTSSTACTLVVSSTNQSIIDDNLLKSMIYWASNQEQQE